MMSTDIVHIKLVIAADDDYHRHHDKKICDNNDDDVPRHVGIAIISMYCSLSLFFVLYQVYVLKREFT